MNTDSTYGLPRGRQRVEVITEFWDEIGDQFFVHNLKGMSKLEAYFRFTSNANKPFYERINGIRLSGAND